MRRDKGASAIEYGAVIALVAAILGALIATGLPSRISGATTSAVCTLLDRDCGEPGSDGGGNGTPDGEEDRNGDGTPDGEEDRNGDGTPDGEEDRNDNGRPDGEEDSSGGLPDAGDHEQDGDGTPDGEEDRNGNGTPDGEEDRNGDGTPDGEEDRNDNGRPDGEEDNPGGLPDADGDEGNGTPDGKEDRNGDGTPDGEEDRNGDGTPDGEEDRDDDGTPDGEQDNPDGLPDAEEEDGGNGTPDGEEDRNGDGTPDGEEDRDDDGTPDGEQDRDDNGTPDGEEDNPGGLPDPNHNDNDDNKDDDNKDDDNKDDDNKDDDNKDDDNKDDDNKDEDNKDDDNKDDDNKDEDNKDEDNKDEDNKDEDNKDEDNKDEDNKDDDNKDDDNKDDDNKDDDNKDEDNKDEDNKDEDNKDDDNKDDDNKDDDNKDDDNDDKDDGKDDDYKIDPEDKRSDEEKFIDDSSKFDKLKDLDLYDTDVIKDCLGEGDFKQCLIDNIPPPPPPDFFDWLFGEPPPELIPEVYEGIDDASDAINDFRDDQNDTDQIPDDDLIHPGDDEGKFVDESSEFDFVNDHFKDETIDDCLEASNFKECLIDNEEEILESSDEPPLPEDVFEGVNDADKALKNFRDNNKEHPEDEDAETSCEENSFAAGTPIDTGTGRSVPIEDIEVGDQVLAADPTTGEQGLRTVTHLIPGEGEKDLVDLDVGGSGLTVTDEHPFWVPELDSWVDAGELRPGMWLRTSTGTWSQVEAVEAYTVRHTAVYNFTVDDLHTYFAGPGSLLVHNAGPSCSAPDLDWSGTDPKGNTRKQHVALHDVDDTTKPNHGVWGDPTNTSLTGEDLSEEAWDKVQSNNISPTTQGSREVYEVDMGREIGHGGGKKHAGSSTKPKYDKVKIVVDKNTNKVVTVFPKN